MRREIGPTSGAAPRRVLVGAGLLAAATLAEQLALTRLFSFLYWHHAAFFVVGVALLGLGAGGTLLATSRGVDWAKDPGRLASVAALASSLGVGLFLLLGPLLDLEPLALTVDPWQMPLLLALELLVLPPFVGCGVALGALLAAFRADAPRVYGADLLGAALGCASALVLFRAEGGASTVLLASSAASALASFLVGSGRVRAAAALVSASAVAAAVGLPPPRFLPAPSKGVREFLTPAPGGPRIERTVWSATLRLDVTSAMRLPFLFNGSLAVGEKPPEIETRIVFEDGAAPTFLHAIDDPRAAAFLGDTNQSLAYAIRPAASVCVIGAGGGTDVSIALRGGARAVTAVEVNGDMLRLFRTEYDAFLHGLYNRKDVRPIVSEGRHFLAATRERFDVIQMTTVITRAALASGALALSESPLYTVEAGGGMLNALAPDGLLSSSGWYLEPAETRRFVSGLGEALRRLSMRPAGHVFVVHAGDCATTLVCRRPFTPGELEALRAFASTRGWPILFDPERASDPVLSTLLGEDRARRETLLSSSVLRLEPATDDRPFFFQLYKWSSLFRGHPPPPGDALLLLGLVQSMALSALLIAAPLLRLRGGLGIGAGRDLAFSAALGAGFMTVEMTAIEAFTVFLGAPVLSLAVTLAALLVATGIGAVRSGASAREPRALVRRALLVFTAWSLVTIAAIRPIEDAALAWPLPARAALVVLWLAPAGLALGRLFPTLVRSLGAATPAAVPLAAGVNGCVSVVASSGAVLLAMQTGFAATLALAVAVYWAGFALWRPRAVTSPQPASASPRPSASPPRR